MPVNFRKFQKDLRKNGYSVVMTSKGHYWVVRPDGGKLEAFAVGHGRNKGEVLDVYIKAVEKAIELDQ